MEPDSLGFKLGLRQIDDEFAQNLGVNVVRLTTLVPGHRSLPSCTNYYSG